MAGNNWRWEIIDVSGVKITSGNVSDISQDRTLEIPVDNLNNGVYQLRFSDSVNVLLNRFVIARRLMGGIVNTKIDPSR